MGWRIMSGPGKFFVKLSQWKRNTECARHEYLGTKKTDFKHSFTPQIPLECVWCAQWSFRQQRHSSDEIRPKLHSRQVRKKTNKKAIRYLAMLDDDPFYWKKKKKREKKETNKEVQFSSVAQLCPTLCDPMNCSTPGLPVHHQLPEVTQTHVHRVSDTIQPSQDCGHTMKAARWWSGAP